MTLDRWRLVLGRYAAPRLPPLDGLQARRDQALEQLYGREYGGRGHRDTPGTLDASLPTLVHWLGEVRELFPRETVETIERHAVERYGLTELVTDPQTLQRLTPSTELLKLLLTLRSRLSPEVLQMARRIVATVVGQIRLRLEPQVRQALSGRLNRRRHAPFAAARNFDALGTLRRNLKHYDRERRRLVVEQLGFFERNSGRLPWQVILCVDQSGSMADSVIHSAVMAGILAALPALRVNLVVFDTEVVDLSDRVDDPVELLMRVQLGGGTDIGRALRYCGQLVDNPQRCVLVLVTDFCEGGSPAELQRVVHRLAETRVRLLGLSALDGQAEPAYDRAMAERLADSGMSIAALTPLRLAQWLVEVIS